jgi:RNA polymerase sigma-70 factor (ECF subfamily)
MLKKEAAAEDVVQEVFIKLWDKRDTLDGVNNIKSYLFQATKNSSLNWLKSKKNQNESINDVNFTHGSSNNIEEQIEFEETQNKITQALSLLPTKCKAVFLLSRNEDKTYKEIAEGLNISVKTVENHMGKALKILRSELGVVLFVLFLLEKLH